MLDPQLLFAVTDTEPALLPAVSVIELVVLVPLHPDPLTDHVYEVAPLTDGIVYTAVALAHGAVGSVTLAGAAGTVLTGAAKVYAVLDAQLLFAVTDILAAAVPAVSVIELVVLVPLHPVPFTVHVYDVAPDTAGTV